MTLPLTGPRPLIDAEAAEAFEVVAGRLDAGALVLCDHASNAVPPYLASLGLPPEQLARHIGYDIGAEGVARALAAALGAPLVLTRHSRLVIDPNRGDDDPTAIMRLSDGAVVPGNARITHAEAEARRERYAAPYHAAIARALDRFAAAGEAPAVVSVHSMTPVMKGLARPWPVAVLWDADPRLPLPLIRALEADGAGPVGDNEPYDGALSGDTIHRHATARGLAGALIEVRQDLIAAEAGQRAWGEGLARVLAPLLAAPAVRRAEFHPSRAGRAADLAPTMVALASARPQPQVAGQHETTRRAR